MEAGGHGAGSAKTDGQRTAACEELLCRLEGLTNGQSVDLARWIDSFPEIRRAFTIPFTELGLVEDRCEFTLEDGGRISIIGFIYIEVDRVIHPVAEFKRELHLDQGFAEHLWLKVEPRFRGKGVSSALLLRSFGFYRELGLSTVELDAGMETGRWHWARVGFEFMLPKEREAVRRWAATVVSALGIVEPRIETISEATQFARLKGDRDVTLAELGQTLPNIQQRAEVVARENYLALDEPISLGRAVMLTGPSWMGRLDLNGPSFATFKAYADAKAEIARQLGHDSR